MVQTNGKYRYLNLDKETIAKENKREREKQQEGMTYFIQNKILISVYKSKIYSHTLRFFSKLLIIEVKLHVINSYTGQIQAYKLHGRNLYVFWVIQRRVKQYFQWKDNDNYYKQYKSVFLANLNAKAALVGFLPSLKAKNMTPSFPSYRAKR